jgi:hypothetical protein
MSRLKQKAKVIGMKKTRFLFDLPIYKDWLFYVFLFILLANVSNGLTNVAESGGPSLSTGGIVSGLFDAMFRVLLSWFPYVPVIYFIRKLIRKYRNRDAEATS